MVAATPRAAFKQMARDLADQYYNDFFKKPTVLQRVKGSFAWVCEMLVAATKIGLWCILMPLYFVIIPLSFVFSRVQREQLERVKEVIAWVLQAVLWVALILFVIWCLASAVVVVYASAKHEQAL